VPSPYPAAAPHAQGLTYDELHRLGRPGVWRPLVGVPLLVLLFVIGQTLASVAITLSLLGGGASADDIRDKLSGTPASPSFLALVNLGWAWAIPAVWLVAWALHGLRPGWVASVVGRLRWRWFAVCLGLSVVALVLTLMVGALLPSQGSGTVDVAGSVNDWSSELRDFLLVVLLLTPLQAAGEEYVFRGYLAQTFGGIGVRWGRRVGASAAVMIPALLFALAHGVGQDVPIFLDRFAFGLVAGALVLLTGGLEAGIAMHVVNNFFAFGLALAFGDMTETLNPSDGTWWALPVTLTQSVSYLLLGVWMARRMGVETTTGRPILAGSRRPV
jgi:membrane protease YdiL (CAAX protease family)